MFRWNITFAACIGLVAMGSQGCIFKKKGDDGTNDSGTAGAAVDEGPLQFAPIVQFDQLMWENFPVLYYIPPDPVAVVYAFHGSNGGTGYCSKIETIATLNELILADMGFICTESTDRGTGKWNQSDGFNSNEDLQRLFGLHDELVATTDLTNQTPVFTFGFSGGGSMSTFFIDAALDQGLDARAAAPHMSSGQAWGMDFPVIWVIADNDPQPEAVAEAESRMDAGLTTGLHFCPEVAISEDYFTKNPNVTLETSTKTFNEAVRLELVDEKGVRIFPIEEAENWLSTFERESTLSSASLRTEELRVAFAMHRMNGMYARDVRDFFLDAL